MVTIAQRNRAIKKALANEYGRKNVSVRGATGTATGWVHCRIVIDAEDEKERTDGLSIENDAEKIALEAAENAGNKIGTFLSDDGFGTHRTKILVNIVRN